MVPTIIYNTSDSSQFDNILSLEPGELLIWLEQNFHDDIPTEISTKEDLKRAGELLGKTTNIYSYLSSLTLYAKLKVREAKRDKLDKDEIDKCIDRRDIIAQYADTLKFQYNAISRMITVKKQIDDEARMI